MSRYVLVLLGALGIAFSTHSYAKRLSMKRMNSSRVVTAAPAPTGVFAAITGELPNTVWTETNTAQINELDGGGIGPNGRMLQTYDVDVRMAVGEHDHIEVELFTCEGSALKEVDFRLSTDIVEMGPFDTVKTVTVEVLGDTMLEGNEVITLCPRITRTIEDRVAGEAVANTDGSATTTIVESAGEAEVDGNNPLGGFSNTELNETTLFAFQASFNSHGLIMNDSSNPLESTYVVSHGNDIQLLNQVSCTGCDADEYAFASACTAASPQRTITFDHSIVADVGRLEHNGNSSVKYGAFVAAKGMTQSEIAIKNQSWVISHDPNQSTFRCILNNPMIGMVNGQVRTLIQAGTEMIARSVRSAAGRESGERVLLFRGGALDPAEDTAFAFDGSEEALASGSNTQFFYEESLNYPTIPPVFFKYTGNCTYVDVSYPPFGDPVVTLPPPEEQEQVDVSNIISTVSLTLLSDNNRVGNTPNRKNFFAIGIPSTESSATLIQTAPARKCLLHQWDGMGGEQVGPDIARVIETKLVKHR